MAEFQIKIAGRVAAVHALFDSTRDYCARYLTEDTPDFSVTVCHEDLTAQQIALDLEADQEGLRRRVFTDPFLERTALQQKIAEALLPYGVLLLHGSAVAVDGKGYIFTAPCGTGKSTHTRLWRQVFVDRAVMINDDKPFLRFAKDGVFVCGAPWSGKHGLDTNISVPLQGICTLARGKENAIVPISAGDVGDFLVHQCQAPSDPADQPLFDRLVQTLVQTIPLWRMECTIDPQAAAIAYQAMSPKKETCL